MADFTVGNIYFLLPKNISLSKGTAFFLQGLTYSDKVKLRHTHSTLQVKADRPITHNIDCNS